MKKVALLFPPVKWLKTVINDLQSKYNDLQGKYNDLQGKYNDLQGKYNDLQDKVKRIRNDYLLDLCVKNNIHEKDFIFDFLMNHPRFTKSQGAIDYYYKDGKKSANKLLLICKDFFCFKPVALLEFASGYGCVTRHLDLDYFDVTACDIHTEAMDFIKNTFKVKTILSATNPEELDIKETYDVVFALSFFSHMPDRTFGRWINALYKCVKQDGLLIFTTHGKISNDKVLKYSLNEDGYAFFSTSEQGDLSTSDYGTTVSEYSYVQKVCKDYIKKIPDRWEEGFWWEHQDLYIIKK